MAADVPPIVIQILGDGKGVNAALQSTLREVAGMAASVKSADAEMARLDRSTKMVTDSTLDMGGAVGASSDRARRKQRDLVGAVDTVSRAFDGQKISAIGALETAGLLARQLGAGIGVAGAVLLAVSAISALRKMLTKATPEMKDLGEAAKFAGDQMRALLDAIADRSAEAADGIADVMNHVEDLRDLADKGADIELRARLLEIDADDSLDAIGKANAVAAAKSAAVEREVGGAGSKAFREEVAAAEEVKKIQAELAELTERQAAAVDQVTAALAREAEAQRVFNEASPYDPVAVRAAKADLQAASINAEVVGAEMAAVAHAVAEEIGPLVTNLANAGRELEQAKERGAAEAPVREARGELQRREIELERQGAVRQATDAVSDALMNEKRIRMELAALEAEAAGDDDRARRLREEVAYFERMVELRRTAPQLSEAERGDIAVREISAKRKTKEVAPVGVPQAIADSLQSIGGGGGFFAGGTVAVEEKILREAERTRGVLEDIRDKVGAGGGGLSFGVN